MYSLHYAQYFIQTNKQINTDNDYTVLASCLKQQQYSMEDTSASFTCLYISRDDRNLLHSGLR